jgi:hypothetical protein
MPGQFKDIAFNIGVVVQSVVIVVVPVVVSLLIVDLVRRLRMHERLTARGFEVKPVSAPPHES